MTHGRSPNPVLVEACVTSVREAVDSVAAGARRLELCRDLEVGGLTPPPDLVAAVVAAVDVPVFVMARPRAGAFVFSPGEVETTERHIWDTATAGAHGIVLGALTPERHVDDAATRRLVHAADGLPVTFHRALDAVPDPVEALEILGELGVSRVLTSGGAPTAREGASVLATLVSLGAGRLEILAGGGVRGDHVRALVEETGVREVHARAQGIPGVVAALRD